MSAPGEILVVDDQDRTIDLCRRAMPEHRWRGPARSLREAEVELTRGRRVEVVVLDVHFDIPVEDLVGVTPGMDARQIDQVRRRQGVFILEALRRRWPDLPVVLTTTRDELPLDEFADRLDVEEYTWFQEDDVLDARSLQAQIAAILASRRGELSDGPVYWGRTAAMRRIRQRLDVLARGRLPVVILGPTGTGKSLVARHYVHERSGRKGAFVAVDLSTVPRDLMAAHLFGSVRGAYTGSVSDRIGAFEAASGGTLFLDEVGNLAPDAQKMLLSVLQEGVVTRVGDVKERRVDTRLVVATNEDLAARVKEGSFRADLYMRLNPAAAVVMPPLVDRIADLEALVRFSVEQSISRGWLRDVVGDYRARHGLPEGRVEVMIGAATTAPDPVPGVLSLWFPERVIRLLRAHPWPGNLRELAMTVENAITFAFAEPGGDEARDRADIVPIRPKVVRDLLGGAGTEEGDAATTGGWRAAVTIAAADTLNRVAVEVERQYFEALWIEKDGDFEAMAEVLLGDRDHARKVQLRFNQLGLKVRDLRERVGA